MESRQRRKQGEGGNGAHSCLRGWRTGGDRWACPWTSLFPSQEDSKRRHVAEKGGKGIYISFWDSMFFEQRADWRVLWPFQAESNGKKRKQSEGADKGGEVGGEWLVVSVTLEQVRLSPCPGLKRERRKKEEQPLQPVARLWTTDDGIKMCSLYRFCWRSTLTVHWIILQNELIL